MSCFCNIVLFRVLHFSCKLACKNKLITKVIEKKLKITFINNMNEILSPAEL